MKDRGRDAHEHLWKRIKPELGHLFIEKMDTSALDGLKSKLPKHLGPTSISQHLILIRAVLRFLWKRGRLKSVPYVPIESVPKPHVDWYTEKERGQLLEGVFRLEPQWHLFYYLTMRLGLHAGKVYGVVRRQIRREPFSARRRQRQRRVDRPIVEDRSAPSQRRSKPPFKTMKYRPRFGSIEHARAPGSAS
jgi:hypothetical protein